MKKIKFEIIKDKKKEFRIRILGGNGEILSTTEGYKKKQSAMKVLEIFINLIKNPKLSEKQIHILDLTNLK